MPSLPRTSLASLVCPSAPFVAPRLLRTFAPLAALASPGPLPLPAPARRYKSDGKNFRRLQLSQRQAEKQKILDNHAATLLQMRKACRDRDPKAMMDLYPSVLAAQALTHDDTRKLAQAIHYCMRSSSDRLASRNDLLPFVQQVIQDLQKGNLTPHPAAYVHLLGMYKERRMYDEGYALWQWLAQQDDRHVSQAVYGAAIELLAHGKQLRLPELENLYLDALRRFPGTFAHYHLSPDAIVPNRAQPTVIANLPMTLFQGILTARILHNDWQKSYLALDTALRLYPSQLPTRFFDLFVNNRPLNEAYTVFLVACRAGSVRSPGQLTGLLANIKTAMGNCEALRDRIVLLRASANAIYAHLQAGGTLEPITLASFLTSFGSLIPEPAPGRDFEGDMALLRNRIVTFAHGILSSLFQAGISPSPNAFTALIHLAGRLRVPNLLRVSLQDVKAAQLDIGEVGLRTVLASAGQTAAKDLLEETWTRIAHNADSQGKQIDWRDWITLAKACRNANHLHFFRTQLAELEHAIHPQYKGMVMATLDGDPPHSGKSLRSLDLEAFDANLDALDKQVKNITAIVMSGQRLDIRQTPFYMSLDPQKIPLANTEDFRKVYDEYTVDQHQPPAEHTPSAFSSTGIPLDELRFANWVSVVELMDQAYSFDKKRQQMIERTGSDDARGIRKDLLYDGRTSTLTIDRLRERIKILRERPVGNSISRNPLAKLKYDRGNRRSLRTKSSLGTSTFTLTAEQNDAPKTPPLKTSYQRTPNQNRPDMGREAEIPLTFALSKAASTPPTFPAPPPRLRYYTGLKSDHSAPPPTLSFRPLGKRKSPNHYLFRHELQEEAERAGDLIGTEQVANPTASEGSNSR